MRSVIPGVATIAAAAATVLAIGAMPRLMPLTSAFGVFDASGAQERAVDPGAVMGAVTADRLSAVIGREYGLRFSAADGSSGGDRVEESSARLGSGRVDVVLFGGLPHSVHSMACEVTQVGQQGAADLLTDCARVVAGDAGGPAVSSWIRATLKTAASGAAVSTVADNTHYALRAVPAARTWVLSMSADGS